MKPEVVGDVEQRERAPAEVVGHRLLRDRVGGDLPEEEREEPENSIAANPAPRPASRRRPSRRRAGTSRTAASGSARCGPSTSARSPGRARRRPDRRARRARATACRPCRRPPARGSSRRARTRTGRTPRTGTAASGTTTRPMSGGGAARDLLARPPRSMLRIRRASCANVVSCGVGLDVLHLHRRRTRRSPARRHRRRRRPRPRSGRRRRPRTRCRRSARARRPPATARCPASGPCRDSTSGIAADFTARATRATACAAMQREDQPDGRERLALGGVSTERDEHRRPRPPRRSRRRSGSPTTSRAGAGTGR